MAAPTAGPGDHQSVHMAAIPSAARQSFLGSETFLAPPGVPTTDIDNWRIGYAEAEKKAFWWDLTTRQVCG